MKNKLPIAILVSGSGTNLQAIIDSIEAGRLSTEIKIVISNKPEAMALERCKKHSIKSAVYNNEEEMMKAIKESGAELICLAGFMKILSPKFVLAFKGKIINIHPSLLPSFPGLHAQRRAFEYGAKVTGCTVHFVDEKLDHGPIIIQVAVPVRGDDTEESLTQRILKEEHKIYPEAIRLFAEGKIKIKGRRVLIVGEK